LMAEGTAAGRPIAAERTNTPAMAMEDDLRRNSLRLTAVSIQIIFPIVFDQVSCGRSLDNAVTGRRACPHTCSRILTLITECYKS